MPPKRQKYPRCPRCGAQGTATAARWPLVSCTKCGYTVEWSTGRPRPLKNPLIIYARGPLGRVKRVSVPFTEEAETIYRKAGGKGYPSEGFARFHAKGGRLGWHRLFPNPAYSARARAFLARKIPLLIREATARPAPSPSASRPPAAPASRSPRSKLRGEALLGLAVAYLVWRFWLAPGGLSGTSQRGGVNTGFKTPNPKAQGQTKGVVTSQYRSAQAGVRSLYPWGGPAPRP